MVTDRDAQINVNRLARLEAIEELVLVLALESQGRASNKAQHGLVKTIADLRKEVKRLRKEGGA